MTDKEKKLCEILNQYCFDNIWNEPLSELRQNIQPILFSRYSQSSNFIYKNEIIPVPKDKGPYFLYGLFDSNLCMKLPIPSDTWISLEELCNTYNILIDMYNPAGRVLHKAYTFIYINRIRTRLVLAVEKNMSKKFIDLSDMENIYFTAYLDSDVLNDCTVQSYFIPTTDTTDTYKNKVLTTLNNLSNKKDKIIIYVNGEESTVFDPILSRGDYIDIIIDDNIQITFDIDISDVTTDFEYLSEMDKNYRQIVHIPKSLNPDNKVITHNTCDFWIRKKHPTTRTIEGTYLHRAARVGVVNITHNDFGIPVNILDAFRDHLDTQEITLHCVCRIHDKDNVLVRDASFIDLLYDGHDDTQICTILKNGPSMESLSFWKASQLEMSPYVKLFMDIPELYSVNIDYYVSVLGYYHTIVLLASRVATKSVTPGTSGEFNTRAFSYTKPPLYRGYETIPIVYKNGYKLRYNQVIYRNTNETIDFNLTEDVLFNVGDVMNMVLYLDGNKTIYKVNVNDTNTFIVIPYKTFKVYEIITDDYRIYKGVNQSSNISYKDVTDALGLYALHETSDGTYQLSYGPDMKNKSYIICNTLCSYTLYKDINDLVLSGENINIPLEYITSDTTYVPIINFNSISVYLNGKYLIQDLDFIVNTIYDKDNNISFKQVVIQSFEYFRNDNGINYVELLLNTDEIDDRSMSFQINNTCTDPTPANLWFPTVSLLHVDGSMETNVTDKGTYLTLPEGKYREGAPYEVQTSVPSIVRDFITQYYTNIDKKRIADINTYFGQLHPYYKPIVLLPKSHRIYSTLINRVVRDILNEGVVLADDPDVNKLMEQLLDYEYLRTLDIVQIDTLDTTYVDYYPAYGQYNPTPTTAQLNMIKRIITKNMPVETIRDKAATYI